MENITHAYFYFLVFFLVALLVTAGLIKVVSVLSRKLYAEEKKTVNDDGYAGGFHLLSPVTRRFSVHFIFIALMFVLFNAELLLLLPWAMALRLSHEEGVATAMTVIVLWGIGYYYEYKKGALEWK